MFVLVLEDIPLDDLIFAAGYHLCMYCHILCCLFLRFSTSSEGLVCVCVSDTCNQGNVLCCLFLRFSTSSEGLVCVCVSDTCNQGNVLCCLFLRFSTSSEGLLIASDVAARGLDFPNVHHVIHYDVGVALE